MMSGQILPLQQPPPGARGRERNRVEALVRGGNVREVNDSAGILKTVDGIPRRGRSRQERRRKQSERQQQPEPTRPQDRRLRTRGPVRDSSILLRALPHL